MCQGMNISFSHPSAAPGMPVFLDDKGELVAYTAGFREVRSKFGLTAEDLAKILGVSTRTIDGYAIGRKPTAQTMLALSQYLRQAPKQKSLL